VELERTILAAVPGVLEVAAVGIPAPGGGPELLHLFVVRAGGKAGADAAADAAAGVEAQLASAAQGALKASLNPLFKVHRVLLVRELPRTTSNKIMRRVLRDQVLAAAPAATEGAPRPRL
jgi:acyl-coenzyme A synthetase/AMP-(fatty) acid ligase